MTELEHVFDYAATLEQPLPVGPTPGGTRVFYGVTGGEVSGPRLNATVLPGGGDWSLMGADGWARLDVRGQGRTDDGAFFYMYYEGLLELNAAVQEAIASGGETAFEDQYFRTAPRFECGDERYAWLGRSLFVAEGRLKPNAVEYRVYRVA